MLIANCEQVSIMSGARSQESERGRLRRGRQTKQQNRERHTHIQTIMDSLSNLFISSISPLYKTVLVCLFGPLLSWKQPPVPSDQHHSVLTADLA